MFKFHESRAKRICVCWAGGMASDNSTVVYGYQWYGWNILKAICLSTMLKVAYAPCLMSAYARISGVIFINI